MKVETEVREVTSPAQHHSARAAEHGGEVWGLAAPPPPWPLTSHSVDCRRGAESFGVSPACPSTLPWRKVGAGVLGVGETGIESAKGCHLLLAQVKPQEMPRASVRLFSFP